LLRFVIVHRVGEGETRGTAEEGRHRVIASVHIADVGVRTAFGGARNAPRPTSVPGLRHANIGLAAPLSKRVMPSPQLGRVGLIAFWDDEEAIDRFEADHPLAKRLSGGWHARLAPLRMFGSWPGVPDDIARARTDQDDGDKIVLTLGRLKLPQAPRFLRRSAKAEGALAGASGLTWATGLAKPPFFATCSLWQSTQALSEYAYGRSDPAHSDAIHEQAMKAFHHESAFIRFRPLSSAGSLGGKNPLAASGRS